MKRPRWIVYWSVQDPNQSPPWPLCAGHAMRACHGLPLEPTLGDGSSAELLMTQVEDGICALAAFGNCKDTPVCTCDGTNCKCIPELDVCCLDREEM